MAKARLFRIVFHNQGQVYELFARSVRNAELFGFVEVEKVLFGERTQVVVDPGEERLKNEFKDVQRFMVPMHAVIRIDEVEKQGTARIASGEAGSIPSLPTVITLPSGKGSGPKSNQ